MNGGIQFHNVDYRYAKSAKQALDDCSLHIPKGSIFGLIGPNGAGKTTLLRHITNLLQCDAGELEIDSEFLDNKGVLDKNSFSLLLENPGVYKKLTIYEYLRFFGQFYAIENLDEQILNVTDSLDIESLSVKMKELSLGNIQKVHIARCFLKGYKLILLDEPTSNLDPIIKEKVWELINYHNREFGTTIIICSHQLHELEEHCTDYGFIKNGHIAFSGSSDTLLLKDYSLVKISIDKSLSKIALEEFAKVIGVDVTQKGSDIRYECTDLITTNTAAIKFLMHQGVGICEVVAEKESINNLYKALVEC